MALEVDPDANASDRVVRFLRAWSLNDGASLDTLYHDDATHRGPGVSLLYPGLTDATLRSRASIKDFVDRIAAADLGEVTIRITAAYETGQVSITEYGVSFPDGRVAHWAEIDEWDGDRVRTVRAYHLPIE